MGSVQGLLSQEQKDMRVVMPQPGRGGFLCLALNAGAGKGQQLRHGDPESTSHPRGELSPWAELKHTATMA